MEYEVIPWAPRYEVNPLGTLRNRKTGRILKWYKSKGDTTKKLALRYRGTKYNVTQPSLLREMFGQPARQGVAMPVMLTKGNRSIHFDSMNQCRAYLAKYCGLTLGTARQYLHSRKSEIAGWKVQYFD